MMTFFLRQDPCLALMERVAGFEPVTSCLGSKHSTAELHPQKQSYFTANFNACTEECLLHPKKRREESDEYWEYGHRLTKNEIIIRSSHQRFISLSILNHEEEPPFSFYVASVTETDIFMIN